MSALSTKLRRDLVLLLGQVITISVVIACGIAAYVSMRGCWKSIEDSRDEYYREYRLGDAFVHLSRAPDAVAGRIAELDGVALVEPRLFETVRVLIPGEVEAVVGLALSLPEHGAPRLNRVWLRSGRLPDPARSDEACLLSGFADPWGIAPGDRLSVVLNGRLRTLRITGLVDSPEFVFAPPPGQVMPTPGRLAVLWMPRGALAAAFQLEGAFDDLVLRLEPDTAPEPVLDATDRILAPYGGAGAVAREDQISHRMLEQEMAQLRSLALTVPVVFLGVAAFLLQIALGRIVELQRTQIATLKAFGYTRTEIGLHFLGLVTAVALVGTALGLGVGVWFGGRMTELYAGFFHLPLFRFRLDPELVGLSAGASTGAAVAGTLGTVLRVVAMAPAEAMQPPAPPSYRPGWLERAGLLAPLPPVARMTVRNLIRQPVRAGISALGVAAATGVIVLGRFSGDAIGAFEDQLFRVGQVDDIDVVFAAPVPERDVRGLRQIPGVRWAEGGRMVPVRFSSAQRTRDGTLIGHPGRPRIRRLVSWPRQEIRIPASGVVVTDVLAEILGIGPGDPIRIEVRTGRHQQATLRVEGLIREPVGLQAHGTLETVARALREPVAIDEAWLSVAPGQIEAVVARLQAMPGVLGATAKGALIERFRAATAETRWVFVGIATTFGAALAVAILYNNARIALSARARDLASLRVLGFGRGEVAAILIGEQAVHLALGVPIGWWFGRLSAAALMSTIDEDTWRFPAIVSGRTYLFATLVVLGAGAAAAVLVWRRIADLDLIGVLKTRE